MESLEHFNQGQLGPAIDAATAAVKSAPTNADLRGTLADLLCFRADYERADKHLEAITTLAPGAGPVVALVRQLVRAEQWRQQFHTEGRTPEFLTQPTERIELQLKASIALREGQNEEAAKLLGQAEEMRTPLTVEALDGSASYDEFRDCDDLIGGVLEVFTSTGKYFWVPMETVRTLEPRPIERPRDLLWRRVGLDVEGGPEGEVYLPAMYAPMAEDAPDEVRLGRVSEFSESEPVRGLGRRLFLLGDDVAGINDLPALRVPQGDD